MAAIRSIPSLLCTAAMLLGFAARAQVLSDELPKQIRGLEISDSRGAEVPLDVNLYDAQGAAFELGAYFTDQRPVVLLLVYYDCPLLCGQMLAQLADVVNGVDQAVGEDYKIVVVSFDHTNTTQMAADKQASQHRQYDRGLTSLGEESFRFHTTSDPEVRRLADAVGFDYRFHPESGEFSHASVLYVLTPDGRVSSYLSGLDYEPRQLKLALLDASDGKTAASIGDFFLHMCFRFDPKAGAFFVSPIKIMRVAGVLSIVAVAGLIIALRLTEPARRRRRAKRGASRSSIAAPPSGAVAARGAQA